LITQNFDLLTKQHEMIREKIRLFQEQKEISKEIDKNLELLIRLLEEHSKCEEQILMPLLKEIYPSQPEILQYVTKDHEEVEKGLSELMKTQLVLENIPKIKSLLNQIVVHFVEEEKGLFPLLKTFLSSRQD
jgi:iron-sulfur cluster repair protein YtfE (RIC family)